MTSPYLNKPARSEAKASSHTPGPWTFETVKTSCGLCHKVGPFPWKEGQTNHACIYDDYPRPGGTPELVANARLIAAAPDLLAALEAASGYLLNAKIDLETGATKSTAVRTIDGGLKVVRAAIAKATGP